MSISVDEALSSFNIVGSSDGNSVLVWDQAKTQSSRAEVKSVVGGFGMGLRRIEVLNRVGTDMYGGVCEPGTLRAGPLEQGNTAPLFQEVLAKEAELAAIMELRSPVASTADGAESGPSTPSSLLAQSFRSPDSPTAVRGPAVERPQPMRPADLALGSPSGSRADALRAELDVLYAKIREAGMTITTVQHAVPAFIERWPVGPTDEGSAMLPRETTGLHSDVEVVQVAFGQSTKNPYTYVRYPGESMAWLYEPYNESARPRPSSAQNYRNAVSLICALPNSGPAAAAGKVILGSDQYDITSSADYVCLLLKLAAERKWDELDCQSIVDYAMKIRSAIRELRTHDEEAHAGMIEALSASLGEQAWAHAQSLLARHGSSIACYAGATLADDAMLLQAQETAINSMVKATFRQGKCLLDKGLPGTPQSWNAEDPQRHLASNHVCPLPPALPSLAELLAKAPAERRSAALKVLSESKRHSYSIVSTSTMYPAAWKISNYPQYYIEHLTRLSYLASLDTSDARIVDALDVFYGSADYNGMRAFVKNPASISGNAAFGCVAPAIPTRPREFQRKYLMRMLSTMLGSIAEYSGKAQARAYRPPVIENVSIVVDAEDLGRELGLEEPDISALTHGPYLGYVRALMDSYKAQRGVDPTASFFRHAMRLSDSYTAASFKNPDNQRRSLSIVATVLLHYRYAKKYRSAHAPDEDTSVRDGVTELLGEGLHQALGDPYPGRETGASPSPDGNSLATSLGAPTEASPSPDETPSGAGRQESSPPPDTPEANDTAPPRSRRPPRGATGERETLSLAYEDASPIDRTAAMRNATDPSMARRLDLDEEIATAETGLEYMSRAPRAGADPEYPSRPHAAGPAAAEGEGQRGRTPLLPPAPKLSVELSTKDILEIDVRICEDTVKNEQVSSEVYIMENTGTANLEILRSIAGGGKTTVAKLAAALCSKVKSKYKGKLPPWNFEIVFVCDSSLVRAEVMSSLASTGTAKASLIERDEGGCTITSNFKVPIRYKHAGKVIEKNVEPGFKCPDRDIFIMSSEYLTPYVLGRRDGGSKGSDDEGSWYGNPHAYVIIDEFGSTLGDLSAIRDLEGSNGDRGAVVAAFRKNAPSLLLLANVPRMLTVMGASIVPNRMIETTIKSHQQRDVKVHQYVKGNIFLPSQFALHDGREINIWELCPPGLLSDLLRGFTEPLLKRTVGHRAAVALREKIIETAAADPKSPLAEMLNYANYDLPEYNGDAISEYSIGLLYFIYLYTYSRVASAPGLEARCQDMQGSSQDAPVKLPPDAPWPQTHFATDAAPYRCNPTPATPAFLEPFGIQQGWKEPPASTTCLARIAELIRSGAEDIRTSRTDSTDAKRVALVLDPLPYEAATRALAAAQGRAPADILAAAEKIISEQRAALEISSEETRKNRALARARALKGESQMASAGKGEEKRIQVHATDADIDAAADRYAAARSSENPMTGNPYIDPGAPELSKLDAYLLSCGIMVLDKSLKPSELQRRYDYLRNADSVLRSSRVTTIFGDSKIAYGINMPNAEIALITPRAAMAFSTETLMQFCCRVGRAGMSHNATIHLDHLTLVRILEAYIHETDGALFPNIYRALSMSPPDHPKLGASAERAHSQAIQDLARYLQKIKALATDEPAGAPPRGPAEVLRAAQAALAGPKGPKVQRLIAACTQAPDRALREGLLSHLESLLPRLGNSARDCEMLPKVIGALQAHAHEELGVGDFPGESTLPHAPEWPHSATSGAHASKNLCALLSATARNFSQARDRSSYDLHCNYMASRHAGDETFCKELITRLAREIIMNVDNNSNSGLSQTIEAGEDDNEKYSGLLQSSTKGARKSDRRH